MSRSFNKNFKIFFRVFSYDTTRNQIQFFSIVCTSAKNKFSYIVSTIVEFVTCCSLLVLFLPKSLLHSRNYWTLLPLQYLFFFSVIINTNLGATFRYLKPNNSAMSLIVTSLLQFLLGIKIADCCSAWMNWHVDKCKYNFHIKLDHHSFDVFNIF